MILEEIKKQRLIAIVRGLPPQQLRRLIQALHEGGVGLVEVTFDQHAPETWKDTAAGIRMIAEEFAGEVLPGAGTVITAEQLNMAYEAGAQYIISPHTDEQIIRATKILGLASLPGAMTASEIVRAYQAGADFVKVFPADTLGPGYIKALKAPLSHIPLLAVGGVDAQNAAAFVAAGAAGVGVGGSLVKKNLIADGQWDRITRLARVFTEAVQA